MNTDRTPQQAGLDRLSILNMLCKPGQWSTSDITYAHSLGDLETLESRGYVRQDGRYRNNQRRWVVTRAGEDLANRIAGVASRP